MAHNNICFIEKLTQYFQEKELFYVKKSVLNGDDLLREGNLDGYDIVIAKDALTQVTALYALDGLLSNTKKRPDHIILITPFVNEFISQKCITNGIHLVHDCTIKISDLYNMVYELEIKNGVSNKYYFDEQAEVINLLKKIGLLKTYIGYTYFEYVLNIMLEKSENIYKNMNDIYHTVASHFNTSSGSVEKAMRSCIKSSLSKSDGFYAKMLFGHDADNYPSTSTFLQVCIKTLKEQKSHILNQQIERTTRKI